MQKPVTLIAVLFISLIALAHVFRVITAIEITIAGFLLPIWMNAAAAVFCGVLAFLLYRERWR